MNTRNTFVKVPMPIRAGLYIVKLVNKPIQSNEFHSIMDDLYQSIISH